MMSFANTSPDAVLGALPDLAIPDRLTSGLKPKPLAAAAKAAPGEIELAAHFLSRTTFGYSEDELDLVLGNGLEAYLEWQLDPEQIEERELDNYLAEALPSLEWDYRQLFDNARSQDSERNSAAELIASAMLRQLLSARQLYEVMVEFWTNHFNVFLFDGPVYLLKTVDDREHIRPHALGRFRDLLHANAQSPAMLYYLDNYSNTVEGPNENYARELLELHTLGVDGGYTEHDVKEIARAFTGWTLDPRSADLSGFDPRIHDFGPKLVLGENFPPDRGIEEGMQVLDMLAEHPSTARFVSEKLVRRFVSDDVDSGLVDRVAATFTDTDGDIKAMLRTLLLSDEFAASIGQKYKRPAEHVVSAIRRVDGQPRGDIFRIMVRQLESLGQLPFFATAPTGYPDTQPAWLATSSLLERWNFTSAIALGNIPLGRDNQGPINRNTVVFSRLIRLDIRPLVGDARSPEAVVDRLVERVLHRSIAEADRQSLIDLAAGDLVPDATFTRYQAETVARPVLAALLASPYFQAR